MALKVNTNKKPEHNVSLETFEYLYILPIFSANKLQSAVNSNCN